MSNKNKNKYKLKEDQLFDLKNFRWYCRRRGLSLTDEMFDVLIKEKFLNPLMVNEEKGPLFSPFQYVVVLFLRHNQIRRGRLYSPDALAIAGGKRLPGIKFDLGSYFRYDNYKFPYYVVETLEKCLTFIHSLECVPIHYQAELLSGKKSDTVSLEYYYDGVDCSEVAEKLELGFDDFNNIRGFMATSLRVNDPMWNWFYYIDRHPRWRREELQGDALVYQQIYFLDYVLRDFGQVVFDKEMIDLKGLEEKNSGLGPKRDDDYVHGVDLRSIFKTLFDFDEWIKTKESEQYVEDEDVELLESFNNDLFGLLEKMGLTLKDLDTDIVFSVEAMSKKLKLEDLPFHLREIAWHKGDDTKPVIKKNSVRFALRHYLMDLQRGLVGLITRCERRVSAERSDLYSRRYTPIWRGGIDTPEKVEERLKFCNLVIGKLYDFQKRARRVFCQRCRKKHIKSLDYGNESKGYLCDDCVDQSKEYVLSGKKELMEQFLNDKSSLVMCDDCGEKLMFKFANRNTFISKTENQSLPVITLQYGHVELSVRCDKCGYVNIKGFNFGWLK